MDTYFLLHSKFYHCGLIPGLLARSSYYSISVHSLPSKPAGKKTGQKIYIVQVPQLFSDQKFGSYTSIYFWIRRMTCITCKKKIPFKRVNS